MSLITLDNLFLLLTGLTAAYLLWRFYNRWSRARALYDVYYMMGFLVLLVSGLLLIFLGLGILSSPYVLTVPPPTCSGASTIAGAEPGPCTTFTT